MAAASPASRRQRTFARRKFHSLALVNIVTHEGTGVLSRATTIQRLNTKGGKAPASGCDTAHVGQEVRTPYTADYLFCGPK